ncbi:hypothetical protein COCNU_08G009630 [Cocos nucifera]|uniref:Uncharacterized protein n=1 Tax=Cocos nucifera TaxID=13894 RepID=A0A8K0N728_COCNU|nr:hypothetical protein COCNU_08G009630 [Cocos nucifera]
MHEPGQKRKNKKAQSLHVSQLSQLVNVEAHHPQQAKKISPGSKLLPRHRRPLIPKASWSRTWWPYPYPEAIGFSYCKEFTARIYSYNKQFEANPLKSAIVTASEATTRTTFEMMTRGHVEMMVKDQQTR